MKRAELIKIIKEEIGLYDKIENTLEKVIDIDDKVGDVWDELADLLDELQEDGYDLGENKLNEAKKLGIEISLRDTKKAWDILHDMFRGKYKLKYSNYVTFKDEDTYWDVLEVFDDEKIEVMNQTLDEISLTGGEEYDTPNAFSANDKDKKKRDKKAAKITGGTIIKEEITSDDWSKLKKIIRMEIASLYFTLYKKRNVWIKG